MSKQLVICVNKRANPDQPSCGGRGSILIADKLQAEIEKKDLPISLIRQKCLGLCKDGPNLKLSPKGRFFHHVSDHDIGSLMACIGEFCQHEID